MRGIMAFILGKLEWLIALVILLLLYQTLINAEGIKATILSTIVICKEPGKYVGWPSIAKTPSGDLLVVFSGDRSEHVSPDGKVQMVRSRDNGKTWSEPVTIYDTPIDDRDSGIIQTKNGTMLVSWFTNKGGGEWQGHWIIRSTDNGFTWGKPIRTEVTTPHGPIQLRDGRLLFAGQRPHESHRVPFTVGVQESGDDGLTWKLISTFPIPRVEKPLSYDEVHLVEVDNGKIIVLFRDCYGQNYIRQSVSIDGGYTWSAPQVTPMRGYPPHVIRLHNGWLLVVYGKRWEPYGEYACISKDQGTTWNVENEIMLSNAPKGDLGYPASVQIDDGSIWTIYYQIDKPGEKPCLMGTHWRIGD